MGIRVISNYPQIRGVISSIPELLSFRRKSPGGGKRFGDELADTAAVAIQHRTVDLQQTPDGGPLPKLTAKYLRWKARKGFSTKVLVRTGSMTEPENLKGDVVVTSNLTVLTAGLGDEEQAKVEWAEEGSKKQNRPPRHFFELSREGEKAIDTLVDETLDAGLKRLS